MDRAKLIIGALLALIPVGYCAGLLYYFLRDSSLEGAEMMGLGPTVWGLAIIGLLFCIPAFVKIVRIFLMPRSPRSDGGDLTASARDGEDDFDADAAVARYMAKRTAEPTPDAAPTPAPRQDGMPTERPGFGRRVR